MQEHFPEEHAVERSAAGKCELTAVPCNTL